MHLRLVAPLLLSLIGCADKGAESGAGDAGQGVKGTGPGLEGELHPTDAELVGFVVNGRGEMAPAPISAADAALNIAWLRDMFEA